MANPEHLKVFHRGVSAWNRWRRKHRGVQPDLSHADLARSSLRLGNLNNANLEGANLEGANLGRAYLEAADLAGAQQRGIHLFGADLGRAVLRRADLGEAQLWQTRLEEADLRDACLANADLRFSDLSRADLRGADLAGANLMGVSLFHADLCGARLTGARLERLQVWDSRFDDADLAGAVMIHVALNNLDLSRTRGLASVRHEEPSSVGLDTLERTALGLAHDAALQDEVETFFRGAGARESYLEVFRQRIRKPVGFYSAFIRHSQADRRFARRLYDALQRRGIRCWLHEHPMLPGDDAHEMLDLGPWDRLLLCLSEAACTSWWIDVEVARAKAEALVPVSLDAYLASGHGHSAESERLRPLLVAEFDGWADDDGVFEPQLERVMAALRVAD